MKQSKKKMCCLLQFLFGTLKVNLNLVPVDREIFMPRHKKWQGIMLYPPNF